MQRSRLEPKCPDLGIDEGPGSMTLSYLLGYGFQGLDPTRARRSHEAPLFRQPVKSMPGEGAAPASFGIEYERENGLPCVHIPHPVTRVHSLPRNNQFGGNRIQVLLPIGVSFRANEGGNNG